MDPGRILGANVALGGALWRVNAPAMIEQSSLTVETARWKVFLCCDKRIIALMSLDYEGE